MRLKTSLTLGGLGLVGVAVILLATRGQQGGPPAAEEPLPAPDPTTPSRPVAPAAGGGPAAASPVPARPAPSPTPAAPQPAAHAPRPSEGQLMDQLHDLGGTNPELSLKLAREGNQRFRDSPNAPERVSIIIKSLLSLNQRDEARDEARRMEQQYPGSPFTSDVHRHMFVQPPTDPGQRGFGKQHERE